MAQGCHLLYSAADREHFDFRDRTPRDEGAVRGRVLVELGLVAQQGQGTAISTDGQGNIRIDADKAKAGGVPEERLKQFAERVAKADKGSREQLADLCARYPHRQADLLTGIGNPHMREDMARAIPSALKRVYQQDKKAVGLFEEARARASAHVSTLKNSAVGKANGCAYELLATAHLTERQTTARNGETLRIKPGDRLEFGPKLQAFYGRQGPIAVTDGQRAAVFHQPHRITVEADLRIVQPGGREIGIDFKHSSTGDKSHVERSQVEGVLVALQTGEIDEFHFVSNVGFDGPTLTAVEEVNETIVAYNQDPSHSKLEPIGLFEHYDWRPT